MQKDVEETPNHLKIKLQSQNQFYIQGWTDWTVLLCNHAVLSLKNAFQSYLSYNWLIDTFLLYTFLSKHFLLIIKMFFCTTSIQLLYQKTEVGCVTHRPYPLKIAWQLSLNWITMWDQTRAVKQTAADSPTPSPFSLCLSIICLFSCSFACVTKPVAFVVG